VIGLGLMHEERECQRVSATYNFLLAVKQEREKSPAPRPLRSGVEITSHGGKLPQLHLSGESWW